MLPVLHPLFLLASPAPLQDAPALPPRTILHCGTLLAVPGGELLREHSLVVEAGRVRELRAGYLLPDAEDSLAGAEVVDLKSAFVMPGWIDCHTHITGELSHDSRLRFVEQSDADAAILAVVHAERTLLAGVTTIRNVGSSGDAAFALRDAIEAGLVRGPRVLCAGYSITPSGGHGDDTHGYREELFQPPPGPAQGVADGIEECRKAVRLQVKRGADLIKVTATGGVLSATQAGTGQQFFDDELRAIVETAHALGRRVAAHAHDADGIAAALRAGVDSIEHGSFLDDACLALFQETGAWLVPTLLAGATVVERAGTEDYFPPAVADKALRVGPAMSDSLGRAWRAGVRIAFGTDSGVSHHGENWRELVLMGQAGMPPMDVLASATVHAAELVGLGDEIGTLEAGKRADVVALARDPLADLAATAEVVLVMRDGRIHRRP